LRLSVPPRPQEADDFHNIDGILVGSDSGFAPCGSVWSVARKSGDSWGGDVRAAVAEALALRSLAVSSLTRGARLAWRGGMGGLHGGGGGVCCGPVKEHLPMMSFDGEGCHRSPWWRACCRVLASVVRCHPRRVWLWWLGVVVNLDDISSPGGGCAVLRFGWGGVPKCAKRKLCPALPVLAMSASLVSMPLLKALSSWIGVAHLGLLVVESFIVVVCS
jgi:hypothetical protein